jgi:ubiquinone/menaquinone biosynthesis C-methylase UbiE
MDRAKFLCQLLEKRGVKKIVTVGSGDGVLEDRFPGDVVAIDISYGMCQLTAATGSVCVQGAAEFLPLKSGSVECLVTDGTYQAVKGRDLFLNEIVRVLSPGGIALVGFVQKDKLATDFTLYLLAVDLLGPVYLPAVDDYTVVSIER